MSELELARLLDLLAERVAERVAQRLEGRLGSAYGEDMEWLDASAAANYLGLHRDTLRKLATRRLIPFEQDGPGCKLYFRRDLLDQWRAAGGARGQRRAA